MNDLRLSNVTQAQAYSNPRTQVSSEEKPAKAETPSTEASINQDVQKAANAQPAKVELNAKDLKKLTEELQKRVGGMDAQIQFSVDDTTGQSIIKVMDRATKEVIRQIPSEEMLQIARGLDRYQEGLLVNNKA